MPKTHNQPQEDAFISFNGKTPKQVIGEVAPQLIFHPNEKYRPITPETFMKNSTLELQPENGPAIQLGVDPSELNHKTSNQILKEWIQQDPTQRKKYENETVYLNPDINGEGMQGNPHSIPMGAQLAIVELKGEKDSFVRMTFLGLNAYNGNIGVVKEGGHDADIDERIELFYRYDSASNSMAATPTWVRYGAHGKYEARWFKGNEASYADPQTKKNVSVAISLNSHAVYMFSEAIKIFSSLYIWRIWGFANDQLKKGMPYQVKEDDLYPMPPFMLYENNLRLGEKGSSVSAYRQELRGPSDPYSATFASRQIPTTLKALGITFWDPKNHVEKGPEVKVLEVFELDSWTPVPETIEEWLNVTSDLNNNNDNMSSSMGITG